MLKVFIMLLGMSFQFVIIVLHRLYSFLRLPAVPVPWQQLLINLEPIHSEEVSISVADQFFQILCSMYMMSVGIWSYFQVMEGNKGPTHMKSCRQSMTAEKVSVDFSSFQICPQR